MNLFPHKYFWPLATASLGAALFTFSSTASAAWDPLMRTSESFGVAETPYGIASADFNGDGLPDIVVANRDATCLSGRYHAADPDYQPMFGTSFLLNTLDPNCRPISVVTADMNLDGRPDIISCNQSTTFEGSSATVFLASGTSTFQVRKFYPIGNLTGTLAVGDLNADGLPDLVLPLRSTFSQNDRVAVMLAASGDSLGPLVTYETGNVYEPREISITDVTGDGKVDLVLTNNLNAIVILPGNNTGTFTSPPITISSVSGAFSLAVASLNGDAIPDMAVTVTGGSGGSLCWVYLGTGGGNFQPPTMIPLGHRSGSLLAGDLDGDGDTDLVEVAITDVFATAGRDVFKSVAVLRNNGNGTFAAVSHYGGLPLAGPAILVDMNLDGRGDLVAANTSASGGHTFSVLLNDGAGGFRSGKQSSLGVHNSREAVADFNGDGMPDVAIADSLRVSIGLGNGDGTFAPGSGFATSVDATTIVTGDVDRDGKIDLLVQLSDQIYIYRGTGDGTFTFDQTVFGNVLPKSLADMSRDGQPDIVGTWNVPPSLVVYRQAFGGGAFDIVTQKFLTTIPTSLCVGDWNRDGILDVAIARSSGLSTFTGSAVTAGDLGPETVVLAGRTYSDVCTGDFNRDGIPDLAARDITVQSLMRGIDVFLGNGNGTFGAPFSYGTFEKLGATLETWDANRDGILDLIASSVDPATTGITGVDILLGNGGGLHSLRTNYLVGVVSPNGGSRPLTAADVDRNGVPDILAGAYAGEFGSSLPSLHAVLATPPARPIGARTSTFYSTLNNPNRVAVGDLNRDGKLDAVTCTISEIPGVAVLLGTGVGALGASTTLAQSWATGQVGIADLNRDGILDVVASNSGVGAPRVSSMLGVGNGTFGARMDLYINAGLDFEIGDMNRDGIPDVVSATQDSVRVLTGNGNGTFTPGSAVLITPCYDLDLADLNRDGVLDIVVAGGTVSVIYGNSNGTLSAPVPLSAPVTFCQSVCVADFNRDGFLDIVAPQSGSYYLLWGAAVSPFTTSATTNLPFAAFDLKVGEAEADGRPFLYVSRNVEWVEVLSVSLAGQFTSVGSYQVANTPESVALGDMDRDGVVDIVSVGSGGSSASVSLIAPGTVTAVQTPPPASLRARLYQNYPNPFNPSTTIRFSLPERDRVQLAVYDVQGRLVSTLEDRVVPAGEHSVPWRGTNAQGQAVASGVYFYRLRIGSGFIESKRMVVVK